MESTGNESERKKVTFANVIKGYLPILEWGAKYNSKTFSNDMIVALIVTMMLIPQSLAYAILAGLPAEIGLYASMAPLILYAIFGTSTGSCRRSGCRGQSYDSCSCRETGIAGNSRIPWRCNCSCYGFRTAASGDGTS